MPERAGKAAKIVGPAQGRARRASILQKILQALRGQAGLRSSLNTTQH